MGNLYSTLLTRYLAIEQEARAGLRDGSAGPPVQRGQEGLRLRDLSLSDEQRQAADGCHKADRGWEDGGEPFNGAQGDKLSRGGGVVLGTAGEYIDGRQCKDADDFAEEGDLLVVRFDQGYRTGGGPDLQRDPGEAGTGPEVDGFRRGGWRFGLRSKNIRGYSVGRSEDGWILAMLLGGQQVASGEERFAEVSRDDLFGIANGCEIDARIPAQ